MLRDVVNLRVRHPLAGARMLFDWRPGDGEAYAAVHNYCRTFGKEAEHV